MTVPKNDVKIGAVSLGCSKNRVDTELMLGRLTEAGYSLTGDPSKADVIIVNTCGFIDDAKEESINTILEMAQYKNTGSLKALVVTGCLSGRYKGDLSKLLPEVDAFLGITAQNSICETVEKALEGKKTESEGGNRKWRPWSPAEIDQLKREINTFPLPEVAERHSRSQDSIIRIIRTRKL